MKTKTTHKLKVEISLKSLRLMRYYDNKYDIVQFISQDCLLQLLSKDSNIVAKELLKNDDGYEYR